MRVTFGLRRVVRRSIGLLIATVLMAAPAVVLASHQFNDVDNDHPFHAEIGAIAGAGIAAGFNDGGYHPSEAVTRQAMAAFMQRGFGRVGLAIGGAPLTSSLAMDAGASSAAFVPVRALTITVPGATTAFSPLQMVHVQGRVVFHDEMSTSVRGCPCEFFAVIRDVTTTAVSAPQSQTFESSESGAAYRYTFDVEAVFTASPGPRTFQLEVGLGIRSSTTNAAEFYFGNDTSLSAATFPFGPTGGNTL